MKQVYTMMHGQKNIKIIKLRKVFLYRLQTVTVRKSILSSGNVNSYTG